MADGALQSFRESPDETSSTVTLWRCSPASSRAPARSRRQPCSWAAALGWSTWKDRGSPFSGSLRARCPSRLWPWSSSSPTNSRAPRTARCRSSSQLVSSEAHSAARRSARLRQLVICLIAGAVGALVCTLGETEVAAGLQRASAQIGRLPSSRTRSRSSAARFSLARCDGLRVQKAIWSWWMTASSSAISVSNRRRHAVDSAMAIGSAPHYLKSRLFQESAQVPGTMLSAYAEHIAACMEKIDETFFDRHSNLHSFRRTGDRGSASDRGFDRSRPGARGRDRRRVRWA